jgi:hypothetical protein
MRLASARQQYEYTPTPATPDEASLIDHALGTLAAQSRAHEVELARWLLRAEAAAVHRRFGCASLAEYVERRLGLGARELREKLRVARALEDLPATAEALRTGAQSWSAVRELTRVATPETEVEWLGFSRGRTVRQVERKVAAHQRGDTPRAPRLHAHAPRRLVFEVAPEDLGTVRAALDVVWREVGGGKDSPTPGRLLVALAEVALGRRAVEVAAYQTSVTVCAGCSRTWQRAGGEQVEVSDAVAGCARCDGEVVGLAELSAEDDVLAEDAHDTPATHVGQTVDARATPRAESATHVGHAHGADAGGHAEPPAELATHVGHTYRADAGGHAVSTAGASPHVGHTPTAERSPHVGHTPAAEPTPHVGHEAAALEHLRALALRGGARPLLRLMTRALGGPLRSVTPQLRRLVFARDGGRCVVPGCTHWRFVDVHHVVPRAHRGPHRLENLACVCTGHHRALHEGVLALEGSAVEGWVVRRAGARG